MFLFPPPALSSLSSQSPPSSPFVTPSAENPPPLLPPRSAHPTDLSASQHEAEKVDDVPRDLRGAADTEAQPLDQSEGESESFGQSLSSPWEPKAWPEGRQVLTHLVEGFVIQEGLQPFPVRTQMQQRGTVMSLKTLYVVILLLTTWRQVALLLTGMVQNLF